MFAKCEAGSPHRAPAHYSDGKRTRGERRLISRLVSLSSLLENSSIVSRQQGPMAPPHTARKQNVKYDVVSRGMNAFRE